jgi:hypothetical protein
MPQKRMEGGPKASKKEEAAKEGSKRIRTLRNAGMNPDGDDEAGDVEDAAAAKVGLPKAVKEKWKRLGGGDVPPDDDSSGEGGKPKRKRVPFRELPAKGKGEGAKKRRIGDGKMGPCADVSKLLDAMKKRKGGK